jgi:hypothetical protein
MPENGKVTSKPINSPMEKNTPLSPRKVVPFVVKSGTPEGGTVQYRNMEKNTLPSKSKGK